MTKDEVTRFIERLKQMSFNCRYDQIQIISKQFRNKLVKELPVKELKKRSVTFKLVPVSSKTEMYESGYRTILNIVAPSGHFLLLLRKYRGHLKDYAIVKIEVVRDTNIESLEQGDDYVKTLRRITLKRWGKNNSCYDQEEHIPENDRFDPAKGSITLYLDQKKPFEFTAYSRFLKSKKLSCRPQLRQEFRVRGSRNIHDKTGIKTIGNLIKYHPAKLYEDLESRYIYFQDYDFSEEGQLKMGKFATRVHGNKVIERMPDESFKTKREKFTCPYNRIMLACSILKSEFEDKPYIDYINWVKEVKRVRREKLQSCDGFSCNNPAT